MKSTKPQKLVTFTYPELSLFYVGSYDADKHESSSSLQQNYNRARYIHQQLLNGSTDNRSLQSGFMIALINTDFDGWERHVEEGEYPDAESAAGGKSRLIEMIETDHNMTFIGSHQRHVKGVIGSGLTPQQWTRKWNISAMTKAKIRDKIEFIVQSLSEIVPDKVYGDAYMATVCPTTHGPRMRNFGPYEIIDLATLFRYVRNYIGKDMT